MLLLSTLARTSVLAPMTELTAQNMATHAHMGTLQQRTTSSAIPSHPSSSASSTGFNAPREHTDGTEEHAYHSHAICARAGREWEGERDGDVGGSPVMEVESAAAESLMGLTTSSTRRGSSV